MLNAYELTEQGVGIAIYPAAAADLAMGENACIKELIHPSVTASYVLIRNRERKLSNVAEEFLSYIKETLNKVDKF